MEEPKFLTDQTISLDDIMSGNIVASNIRARVPNDVATIYVSSGVIRFNGEAKNQYKAKKIAFFISGGNAFFMFDPNTDTLSTFNVSGKKSSNKVHSLNASSSDVCKQLSKIFNDGKKESFYLKYTPYTMNAFGVIYKFTKYIKE